MKIKRLFIALLPFSVYLCGCAGLQFQNAGVAFENPYARLGIQKAEPSEFELKGILLRYKPNPSGLESSKEENVIFAGIRDGKGKKLTFTLEKTDHYSPGSRPDSYVQLSETKMSGQKGSLLDELEFTERGEILRFIRGKHESQIGKFDVTAWTRSPELPEQPVRPGDKWNFREEMSVRIDSPFVKEIDPEPYKMDAEILFEGFAVLSGRRCAILKKTAVQVKTERLKFLFKKIEFRIEAKIQETSFLDYENGRVLAVITQTTSRMDGINVPFSDEGQSQSVSWDSHIAPVASEGGAA